MTPRIQLPITLGSSMPSGGTFIQEKALGRRRKNISEYEDNGGGWFRGTDTEDEPIEWDDNDI